MSAPDQQPRTRRGDRWRDLALYGAAFALPFAAYLLTLGPTAVEDVLEDSAELATAPYVLGVPHPTGYPLYMLLGKAWQLLVPIGSIAYRMNLLSAVCAAAACAVIAWVCRLLDCRRPAALLGGLTAGFFRMVWMRGNGTEVDALSALFVALILAAFLVWHRRRTERSLVALALVCGVAFTHHHVSVFFSVPLLGAALLMHRPVRVGLLLKVAAAVVLTQALYAYVPIRAFANPPINWENARTWAAFERHVTGGPWVERFAFTRRGPELWRFVAWVVTSLRAEITLVGYALGAAGLVVLARRRIAFWVPSTIAFAALSAFASTSPIYRMSAGDEFIIPCLLVLAVWIAAGADGLAAAAARWGPGRLVARWALPALAVALPAHMAVANWRSVDMSRNWRMHDYAQLVLAEAAPRAVVVVRGYGPYMMSLYLHVVEARRPDVTLVPVDLAGSNWYPSTVRDATIRRALLEAQAIRDIGIAGGPGDWTPLLVNVLLSRMEGRRPVYCTVDVDPARLPPGWQVLTVDPLRRMARSPALHLIADTGRPIGLWPEGIGPAQLEASPSRLPRGDVLRLTWRWHTARPVESALGLRIFLTAADWLEHPSGQGPPPDMAFNVLRPFGYAVLPLPATAPGTALDQDTYLVVPRQLTPGRYLIACALESSEGTTQPIRAGTVEIAP